MFKELNEKLEEFMEDYKLIKEMDEITSSTKLETDYNEYYNPNVGNMGTYFGKRITSGVGKRSVDKGSKYHYGLDLDYKNESVYSFCSGIVSFAGFMNGFGRVVFIKDSDGYYHCYAHLTKIFIKNRQIVDKGQLIGVSGGSNCINGIIKDNAYPLHLHYSIWKSFVGRESQNTIDPRVYKYP